MSNWKRLVIRSLTIACSSPAHGRLCKIAAKAAGKPIGRKKPRLYELHIDASKKMERLIDDLLSYSRLGREGMPKREVNLSALLKESIDEISEVTRRGGTSNGGLASCQPSTVSRR